MLLLVHSPAVGPSTWSGTADVLRRNGFRCVVPDMSGATTAGAPFYQNFAAAAAAALDGSDEPLVLVGHSGAGALLPTIADVVGRTCAFVFVDALLPHPGLSWFDTVPPPLREQLRGMAEGGLLPPWHEWFPPGAVEELVPDATLLHEFTAEIPRLPVAYFEEPAPVTRSRDARRCAYLRFSAAYDHAADEAERRGWWVVRKNWDHLRMLTAPRSVADLIAETISALPAG